MFETKKHWKIKVLIQKPRSPKTDDLQYLRITKRNGQVAVMQINTCTLVYSISWNTFLSWRACHKCAVSDCWRAQCHDLSKQQFWRTLGTLQRSYSRWTVARRSAAKGCYGKTGSDAKESSRLQQWPLVLFFKGKRHKVTLIVA